MRVALNKDRFVFVDQHAFFHKAQAIVALRDRYAEFAISEFVEAGLHGLDRVPEKQNIAVAEIEAVMAVIIFGCHITSARKADLAVHDKGLVVHALVDTPEIGHDVQQALLHRDADRNLGL